MDVKIVKLSQNAVVPSYAKEGDAGLDLTATSKEDLGDGLTKYGFGLALEIPKGYAGFLFPRSSSYKRGQQLTNCVGVIDSGYRGEVSAIFNQYKSSDTTFKVGERIAQLVIMPVPYVNLIPVQKLSKSDRGTGGYGSTGS